MLFEFAYKLIKEKELIREQSEEYDKELSVWTMDINKLFDKGIKYNEYFPMFFRYIFESIEVTQKEMYIYNYIKQKRDNI